MTEPRLSKEGKSFPPIGILKDGDLSPGASEPSRTITVLLARALLSLKKKTVKGLSESPQAAPSQCPSALRVFWTTIQSKKCLIGRTKSYRRYLLQLFHPLLIIHFPCARVPSSTSYHLLARRQRLSGHRLAAGFQRQPPRVNGTIDEQGWRNKHPSATKPQWLSGFAVHPET
jgi:hypothetical protein